MIICCITVSIILIIFETAKGKTPVKKGLLFSYDDVDAAPPAKRTKVEDGKTYVKSVAS